MKGSPNTRRIPILTYHSLDESGSVVSVAPSVFAEQLEALAAAGVKTVTLKDAVTHREQHGGWPERAVVITFDDGFANVFEHGAPVLKKLGFAATLFLVTGHVGGKNDWAPRPPRLPECPMLSWSQVESLASQGWEIAAHTHSHPDLRRLERVELEREYRTCNSAIAERVGSPPITLAYPFGWFSTEAAEAAGSTYQGAVTTTLARAGGEARNLLPRVDMYYVRNLDDLNRLITGRWDGYLTIRRWGRALKTALS